MDMEEDKEECVLGGSPRSLTTPTSLFGCLF